MITRVLSRYADARLRAELDDMRDARDQARNTARRLFHRLTAARRALETQAALTERWKSIARQAQTELAEERAEHEATGRRLRLADERVDLLTAQPHTQETHQ